MQKTLTWKDMALAIVLSLAAGVAAGWLSYEPRTIEITPSTGTTLHVDNPMGARVDTFLKFVAVRLPIAQTAAKNNIDMESAHDIDDVSKTETIDSMVVTLTEKGEAGMDSATVVVPIERTVYEDSAHYRAVVEGYMARLVELDIYPQPTIAREKVKRWSIGPAIGIGWSGKGLQPYVGVNLTFGMWQF